MELGSVNLWLTPYCTALLSQISNYKLRNRKNKAWLGFVFLMVKSTSSKSTTIYFDQKWMWSFTELYWLISIK